MYLTLSVLIPVFNEQKTICQLLAQVRSVALHGFDEREIVVVDDCSLDGTPGLLAKEQSDHGDLRIG